MGFVGEAVGGGGVSGCWKRRERISVNMRAMYKIGLLAGVAVLSLGVCAGARAQEQRPMTPPPEHDVKRLGNTPEAVEPPSLPPDEIIRKFVAKEDQFAAARPTFAGKRKYPMNKTNTP